EEPAGDVQASVLFVRRRLGHVQGHPDRPNPLLTGEVHPARGSARPRPPPTPAMLNTPATTDRSSAWSVAAMDVRTGDCCWHEIASSSRDFHRQPGSVHKAEAECRDNSILLEQACVGQRNRAVSSSSSRTTATPRKWWADTWRAPASKSTTPPTAWTAIASRPKTP